MKIIAVYMCIEFIQQDVIMFDNKQALSSSTSPPSTLQHGKRYIYISSIACCTSTQQGCQTAWYTNEQEFIIQVMNSCNEQLMFIFATDASFSSCIPSH